MDMKAAETVASAMESAANAICLVKNTVSLIHTVIKRGGDTTTAGNIPALMAHNEYIMQSTIETLQDSLALAKQQAGPAAVANHPEIQLLEETLTYMRASLAYYA